MGFYIQDDMWEAVSELPRKTQDEVIGSLARLFFEGGQTPLKGVSRSLFVAFRDRVILSTKRSECGKQNGKQKAKQTAKQSADGAESKGASEGGAKSEPSIKEGEGDKETSPKGEVKKAGAFAPPPSPRSRNGPPPRAGPSTPSGSSRSTPRTAGRSGRTRCGTGARPPRAGAAATGSSAAARRSARFTRPARSAERGCSRTRRAAAGTARSASSRSTRGRSREQAGGGARPRPAVRSRRAQALGEVTPWAPSRGTPPTRLCGQGAGWRATTGPGGPRAWSRRCMEEGSGSGTASRSTSASCRGGGSWTRQTGRMESD